MELESDYADLGRAAGAEKPACKFLNNVLLHGTQFPATVA